MKTSTVLALGGLGALAWYLTRRGQGAGAPPGGPFGPSVPAPDDATIAGTEFFGKNDWFLSQGSKGDLCDLPGGNYDTDRHSAWSDDQKRCVSEYHAGRAQSFYDVLWHPASRVPVRSLTATDFKIAIMFLANKLDRRGMPWTYGQTKSVNDFNDTIGALGEVDKYVGPIANAFTFGLWNLAEKAGVAATAGADDMNAGVGDASNMAEAIEKIEAAYAASVSAIPTFTAGGENSLVIKEAASVGDSTWGTADPLAHQYSKAWNAPFIDPWGPSMDFGYEPIEFPWGDLYFMCQLFAPDPAGHGTWRYPWISKEMGYISDGGDGSKITGKTANVTIIARQARLFRTLATLGAMLKPDVISYIYGAKPDAEGNINVADVTVQKRVRPGLYAYKVGAVELWGCCLPAAPEDMASDLSEVTGKRLAGSTYGRDIGETPTQTAQSDYVPYVPPPPPRTAPTASGVPTVTKGAPVPTQTATSGYTLPTSTAGAPTSSPTIAGGGRRLNSII